MKIRLGKSRIVIFVEIIKIVTMFFKQSLKTQEKLKELEVMYQNAIYVCISWYSKFADFSRKNSDISRTQRVCHVIHTSFWIFLK